MTEELRIVPASPRALAPTARDVAAVFFRHKRLWAGSFAVVLAGMLGYGILAPSYEAEMKVLVGHGRRDPASAPTLAASPEFAREPVGEEELNSEAELFRDGALLQRVAGESGLARASWIDWLTGRETTVISGRAAQRLDRQLAVEPLRKTHLIEVRYSNRDPQKALQVLRCLSQEYLQAHVRMARPPGEVAFFTSEVEQARQTLQQWQMRVMNFSRDEGVVSAAQERDDSLRKLAETESAYQQANVNLAATVRRIGMLESQLRSLPERATVEIRNADNAELMGRLKTRLLELQLKRTELLTKFEPGYRLVQEVERQISETRASIEAEDRSPLRDQTTQPDPNHEWAKAELVKAQVELSGLKSQAATLHSQVSGYRQSAQQLGDRAIRQQELLNNLRSAEEKYLLYVNKQEEARVSESLDQHRILDVSLAQEPSLPALPTRSVWGYGLIGMMLGTCLSTGLAFSADYIDPTFRTPDEVIACMGGPVLASLPRRDG